MEKYDVVIVGAGPGGLNCAKILAQAGKSVIVLEKNSEVGPKICAGGLLGHDLEYLKIPDELIDYKFHSEKLHSPDIDDDLVVDFDFIYTIDRTNLGQWQLKLAKEAGTIIRTDSKVTAIDKEKVVINNKEEVYYDFLIGADGSNSFVRKYLGLEKSKELAGIQYIIPTEKYKDIEFFFDAELFNSWYAWIFPHKGYVSIGAGGDPKIISSKQMQDNFHKWLVSKNIDITNARFEGFPINADYQGHQFGNIFLIGDAAGLASYWTGEGIYQALVSGEEIAKIIINPEYVSEKLRNILEHKKLHEQIVEFLIASGPAKTIEYDIMMMLFKNKYLDEKFIEYVA